MLSIFSRKADVISSFRTGDVASILEENQHTPDIWKLEQYELQLLFEFGPMMSFHDKHELLGEDKIFCAAAFTKDSFSHWKKKLGAESYTVALQRKTSTKFNPLTNTFGDAPVPIRGQIYALRAPMIIELDKYHLNTLHFERRRVDLIIPYQNQYRTLRDGKFYSQTLYHEVKAWMYVGVTEYWEPQLDAGGLFSPVSIIRPRNAWTKGYSYFSPLEMQENVSPLSV